MSVAPRKQLSTNSAVQTFKQCRKRFEFAYEIGLRPTEDSFALRYGTAFHQATEMLENGSSIDEVAAWARSSSLPGYWPYTLAAQISAYAKHWAGHSSIAKVLHSEHVFTIEAINPETGRASQTFDLGGKLDAIVKLHDGRIAISERKTISEDPGNNSRYWLRLLMNPQITLYYIAAKRLGFEVETIEYDVMRKPCIEPAMATPMENRKYKKDGTLYTNQREYDETREEWEDRLYTDMMERPEFYMNRREIPRLERDVDQFEYELWDTLKDLREAQRTNRFYRTVSRNCDYCPYFELCSGLKVYEPGIVPEGFQLVDEIHPELHE